MVFGILAGMFSVRSTSVAADGPGRLPSSAAASPLRLSFGALADAMLPQAVQAAPCECFIYARQRWWKDTGGLDFARQLNKAEEMAKRGFLPSSSPVKMGIVVFTPINNVYEVYTKSNGAWVRSRPNVPEGHVGWITTTPSSDRNGNWYFNLRDASKRGTFPGSWSVGQDGTSCSNVREQNMKLPPNTRMYSYWRPKK